MSVVATLLIFAVMRDQLLWLLSSTTGYSPVSADFVLSRPHPPLTFYGDGTFHISIFEDLHFGEAEHLDWGPRQDQMSLKVMRDVLNVEHPSLVVLNGDLITGENTMLENATNYVDMIVKPIVDKGKRWASTYGNHDAAFNLSSKAMLERERQYGSSSLTNSMVASHKAGVTNYYIPVFDKEDDVVPALILWFFDSQGGREFHRHDEKEGKEIVIPGAVDPSVVKWFQETSTGIRKHFGKSIPSLGFVHIPLSAMSTFQNHGIDSHLEPGINDDFPLGSEGPYDKRFVEILKKTEGFLAVFSGHDHGNDFCHPTLTSHTPFFCFGRHTGYGGYGHWMRGSRQIFLRRSTLSVNKPDIDTWIRLEDRTISGFVALNETYGTDVYPKVENKKTKLPLPDS